MLGERAAGRCLPGTPSQRVARPVRLAGSTNKNLFPGVRVKKHVDAIFLSDELQSLVLFSGWNKPEVLINEINAKIARKLLSMACPCDDLSPRELEPGRGLGDERAAG